MDVYLGTQKHNGYLTFFVNSERQAEQADFHIDEKDKDLLIKALERAIEELKDMP